MEHGVEVTGFVVHLSYGKTSSTAVTSGVIYDTRYVVSQIVNCIAVFSGVDGMRVGYTHLRIWLHSQSDNVTVTAGFCCTCIYKPPAVLGP